MKSAFLACLAAGLVLSAPLPAAATDTELPPDIRAVIEAPRYEGATWGIRAVALDSDEPLIATGPDSLFFTGSVRKLFSVGLALNALGADHRFITPVYRIGDLTPDGVLNGDLVLVANADLTLGGRNLPDGTLAFTNFDHTEFELARLVDPDRHRPARRPQGDWPARSPTPGSSQVAGDVVIDDRLFEHFRVPNGNVLITPVIINDNLIDVTILPTEPGQPAKVDWRPKSAAFTVKSEVTTVAAGEPADVTLEISPDDAAVGIVKGHDPRRLHPRRSPACRRWSRPSPYPTRRPMPVPPSSRRWPRPA